MKRLGEISGDREDSEEKRRDARTHREAGKQDGWHVTEDRLMEMG